MTPFEKYCRAVKRKRLYFLKGETAPMFIDKQLLKTERAFIAEFNKIQKLKKKNRQRENENCAARVLEQE